MESGSVYVFLYVHDPSRLRGPGHTSNFDMTIVNQQHLYLEKLDADHRYNYKLTVDEPMSLGLSGFNDYENNIFIRYVIMACNLVMDRVAFSVYSFNSSGVEFDRKDPPPTPVKAEDTSEIIASDVTAVWISAPELTHAHYKGKLDEARVLDTLRKIQSVFDVSEPPLGIHNMQKSLDAYLMGTQSTDKSGAFRGLYESMELAANFDKPNRTGDDIDAEICKVMDDSTLPVKALRCFNDRLKHADTEDKHKRFNAGEMAMDYKTSTLRPIASGVILSRLTKV